MDGREKNEEMPGFCSPASDTEHTMGAASRYDESVKLEGKVASIDTLKELLRHWGCGYRTAGPRVLQLSVPRATSRRTRAAALIIIIIYCTRNPCLSVQRLGRGESYCV